MGACPNLIGKRLGEEIDSYDVVVKTNGSVFFRDQEYFSDYGSRVDVLYTNNQFFREMRPFNIAFLQWVGVKFIRMKTGNPAEFHPIPAQLISDSIKTVNRTVIAAVMGAYIVHDIISHNPKSLHLTGIDFFDSKKPVFEVDNYREYIDGYLPDKIRKQGNEINVGKTQDGHDQYSSTKFIHDLMVETGKITMPDFIFDVMCKILDRGKK